MGLGSWVLGLGSWVLGLGSEKILGQSENAPHNSLRSQGHRYENSREQHHKPNAPHNAAQGYAINAVGVSDLKHLFDGCGEL